MAVPGQVSQWIAAHYPRPRVDPEWLKECYDWVCSDKNLTPEHDMDAIIKEVDTQLLGSKLSDSMLADTGIPSDLTEQQQQLKTLTGPLLVEITAITDIGVSAFSLEKVRAVRAERKALGAEAQDELEEEEVDLDIAGEGPIPNYPRAMLRLELTDGSRCLKGIEYKKLPQLELGVTEPGCKMILKNVLVRRGIAFLEPKCVDMKGGYTDHETDPEDDFAASLRKRLGLPEPPPRANAAVAQPIPDDGRSPLRQITPPRSPPSDIDQYGFREGHSDDEGQPRRRRIPNQGQNENNMPRNDLHEQQQPRRVLPLPLPSSSVPRSTGPAAHPSSSTVVSSSSSTYFPKSTTIKRADSGLGRSLALSPTIRSTGPVIIESDSDDEEWRIAASIHQPRDKGKGKAPAILPKVTPQADPTNADDEFDFGDEDAYDPAFFEEIEKLEMQSMDVNRSRSTTAPSSSDVAAPTVNSLSTLSRSSEPRTAAPRSQSVAGRSRATPSQQTFEVVVIADDSAGEDKENVPAPVRRVKRRVLAPSLDVIEITSD
ncbi:hypothetical protein C8J56DRAFT_823421 [Mycena floridula]|nr:hypothetical protein C8J56DRAFT_823421 [Mycena floridula]